MTPTRTVAAQELRPRRIWFAIAALIGVGGLLAAASVPLFVLRSGGDLGQRLTAEQPATVHLSPSKAQMVWVREEGQAIPHIDCRAAAADGQEPDEIQTVRPIEIVEREVDGEHWRTLIAISAAPAGSYQVTCATTENAPLPSLSIGEPPRFYGARATAIGTVVSFGLAGISIITSLILAIAVAVRRNRGRARLATRDATASSPAYR